MRYKLVSALVLLFSILPAWVPTYASPAAQFAQTKNETVYITRTGKKFHREGCRYLSKSKIPIKRADAIASGYTPCKVCQP